MISQREIDAMLEIPELRAFYELRRYPFDEVLRYYDKFFVAPAAKHIDMSQSTLCDCGTGLGWLSFAFLLRGGKAAMLVDADETTITLARKIGVLLGLADRCTFHCCTMQDIPLPDKSVDVFTSVETLEHVGASNIAACVDKINRVTRRLIIITAPNWLFPIDHHTTRLPFVHWLPKPLRGKFSRAALKRNEEFRAKFLHLYDELSDKAHIKLDPHGLDIAEPPKPWTLFAGLKDFRPISKALTFDNVDGWKAAFPVLIPYGGHGLETGPPRSQEIILSTLSTLLGRWSFFLNWNLSAMWLARSTKAP